MASKVKKAARPRKRVATTRGALPSVRTGMGLRYTYKDVAGVRVTRGPMKGTYRLPSHPRSSDFRDSTLAEAPVWSIGRALVDMPGVEKGEFFAALDARFYQVANWECVWLR